MNLMLRSDGVAAAGAGSSNQHKQFDLIGMKLTCLKLPLIHAGSS